MALGISDFKSQFAGGARNNLFKVVMKGPSNISFDDKKMEFMVKTTSLPASTVESLTVPFRGRDLKIAGKRNFDAWSVTVINDQDFALRESFENWSAAMSYHDVNSSNYAGGSQGGFAGYMVDAQVYQLIHENGKHQVGYGYVFKDMWPSSVGAVELSSEGEAIEEFTVEFQYQYWFSNNGSTIPITDGNDLIGKASS